MESGESDEQHLKADCDDKRMLNSARLNLFSALEMNSVDNTAPLDTRHLLQPKLEDKVVSDTAASVDPCTQEQPGGDVRSTDNVQSIIVKLPLIARLRQIKPETTGLCIKTEIDDGDRSFAAADEHAVQPTIADARTAEDVETDIKKEETTAAAKGLQLARETIANIFGTPFQPPATMKIPIKRRMERDADECNDAKCSRTSSESDDGLDRSHSRQHSWYVLE